MVFYKRRFKKKKFAKTSRSKSTAVKALRLARRVKSMVNTEYKVVDNNINFLVENATYNIQYITGIDQGDDMNQRNGRSVLMKSLSLQMRIYLGSVFNHSVIRLVLIRDNTCQSAIPTMNQIFTSVSGDQAINSFRQVLSAPTNKYTILWDKRINIDADYKDEVFINKYFHINKHIKYLNTTSASTAAGPGSLFLAAICTGVNASGIYPLNVQGQTRLRYIDN